MHNDSDLLNIILSMNTAGDVEAVREKIVAFGEHALPAMVECYPRLTKWQGRNAIVYTAIKYARRSKPSKRLGFMGLKDKSKRVRYHACALAAFSIDPDFLPDLEALLLSPDPDTVADARAAMNAIQNQNHHLFIDRRGVGVRWNVVGSGIED